MSKEDGGMPAGAPPYLAVPPSQGPQTLTILRIYPSQQASQGVGSLSGGERSRLQLALLVLSGANFLLLDEPTNNLDIASAEVLEDALNDFNGTVLVISHDRYFLDRTVNRIFELKDARITEYIGGYSDYAVKAARAETNSFGVRQVGT